ncbi:MAG: preprotein translocase subunit YajC [Oscillospiraceae bacterium]|nr:preprotein translocase subunit YajC [Clostridiaceae bacterium]MDO4495499.1 preprotein translocase subunit YajC [Clostridiaceae bacterium]MDY5948682.1 preprotein translocase subunit YajC [Oscillospiraceae bacterium]
MNFISLLAQSTQSGATAQQGNPMSMIIMMVALFAIMYFVMIRPQKKKQKEEQTMRDSVQVGDEITTIGGIVGRVVTVKEDSLIIETGADRNKMKIMRWAVSTNNTANEKMEAERQAAKEAAEAEKKKKMEEAAESSKAKRKKTKKKDDTFDA